MVPGSRRDLAAGADPAQVGFSPDGATVVVTQRGTNSLLSFPVDQSGLLGDPREIASSGQTPYGFTFADNQTLVVTEAFGAQVGKAAASSYRLTAQGLVPVSRSVGNGRSAICWAVSDGSGRFVYATNFADGAVSRYEVSTDGSLTLADATAGTAVDVAPRAAGRGPVRRRPLPVRDRRGRTPHLRMARRSRRTVDLGRLPQRPA